MKLRERIREERRRRQRIIDNDFAIVAVTRRGRAVRLTVVTCKDRHNGKPCAATFGIADLDDAALDRLVVRLQALRGGRRTNP